MARSVAIALRGCRIPGVNFIDLFIALFIVLAVVRGARTGFLTGAFSLAGLVLGASLGSRLVPFLLPKNEGPVFGAAVTLAGILAFAVLGDVLARAAGNSLQARLRGPAPEALDRLGGAALGLIIAVMLVWVVGILALQAPALTGIYPQVNQSRILHTLNARMPSELITRAVARLDPLPQIHGPEANVASPDSEITSDPDVQSAEAGTVRITGVACGYGIEGSGWVAAPDLIVTNAHVVAGEGFTRVQQEGVGPGRRARVVLFDAKNDIAILHVNNLGLSSLPLASPTSGESVAVLGFPENGPLDVQPGRLGDTQRVISSDAYNQGPVERTVTSLRVFVRPGNSGGPVVDSKGEVVATIFASRANSRNAGYGIPSDIVRKHLQTASNHLHPVDTGPCAR